MTNESAENITVKEPYQDCKGFECSRLRELLKTDENGKPYMVEGDIGYHAIVLCNNWTLGLSDGTCPIKPSKSEVSPDQPQ